MPLLWFDWVGVAEVTQEVAARGMGLGYDMSPTEGKKELVQGLFSTLMEGRKSVVCEDYMLSVHMYFHIQT